MQRVKSAGTILQQDRRRRCLSGATALFPKSLPLAREAFGFTQEPLPIVGNARHMGINRSAQLVYDGRDWSPKISIHALSKIRLIHDDSLGEQRVVIKHAAEPIANEF